MSTPSLVVSLLLLSLLLSQAQGIRLEKGLINSVRQLSNNVQEQETATTASTLCKDGGSQCSGSNRKLISSASSSATTTTTSKNEKINGGNRAGPEPKGEKVNTQPGGEDGNLKAISKHQEAVHTQYSDLTDMTEMDYSPARRKPPIHN